MTERKTTRTAKNRSNAANATGDGRRLPHDSPAVPFDQDEMLVTFEQERDECEEAFSHLPPAEKARAMAKYGFGPEY